MEAAWITSLIAGMFSSLIVGVIMAQFQRGLNKSVSDAKDANDQKFKNVEDKVDHLDKKVNLALAKLDHVEEKVNSMTFKIATLAADQKYLLRDVADLKDTFKDFSSKVHESYGKVVVKK